MRDMVKMEGVVKTYGTGRTEVRALQGVDLDLDVGEFTVVMGPSGSGKSTLLNLIGTLDEPTEGAVRLDGQDLSELGDKQLATLRNRDIGFVFQLHHLLPQLTALENVLVPTLVGGALVPGETPEDRARRLLTRVGLGDRMDYRPGQLSGGERQRVAVVRALINQPKLLLADEPTGSLDRASADALADLLVELNREEKVTLILVTHDLTLAAKMGRVMELRDGELSAMHLG